MATIHMSEDDAASDFKALMDHIRAGSEVIIESEVRPAAVIRPAVHECRTVSESIRLSEQYAKEIGYKPVMDPDFAADMREIIANRKPRDRSAIPFEDLIIGSTAVYHGFDVATINVRHFSLIPDLKIVTR